MRLFMYQIVLLLLVALCSQYPVNSCADPATDEAEVTEESVTDILPAGSVELGRSEDNGVEAKAFLYRQRPDTQLTFTDIDAPYILFVKFTSVEGQVAVVKGLVAYKVETSGGRSAAVKMAAESGYFVSGLSPQKEKARRIIIGSKLDDDHKRQFSFSVTSL